MPTLRPSSRMSTAPRPTSLPVPAFVGIAMTAAVAEVMRVTPPSIVAKVFRGPITYFVDVLQRVGQHPASQVHQLTPRLWKALYASNPLRSDLHDIRERQSGQ
jgi:hypothetical protein